MSRILCETVPYFYMRVFINIVLRFHVTALGSHRVPVEFSFLSFIWNNIITLVILFHIPGQRNEAEVKYMANYKVRPYNFMMDCAIEDA